MSNPSSTPVPLSRGWAADASPQGLVALDRGGRILYANPAMERMLGAPAGGLIGVEATLFHAIPELALSLARDHRIDDGVQGLEAAPTARDEREASVRSPAALLEDGPAGAAVVATVEDITRLRARESSESQARTMDAVGRLAGGMAHHFNNLLASILGHVTLLEPSVQDDAEASGELSHIAVAARRAREIADLLLIVSGKEVGSRERVDLGSWIYEGAAKIRPTLPLDVELQVRSAAGTHLVWMDWGRLEQILVALVSNANEALADGGSIVLEVGRFDGERASDGHLFSPPVSAGSWVCLTVADDGMGMNDETLSRALEPFFSTKRDREGAGLGLATIYGIVAQSGGHVSIESQPVVGTRVRVLLPEFGTRQAGSGEGPSLMAEGWVDPPEVSANGAVSAATMGAVSAPTSDGVTPPPMDETPASTSSRASTTPSTGSTAPSTGSTTPSTGSPASPTGSRSHPAAPIPPGTGILVVDDEDTIRVVMEKILRRAGWQVFSAEDGREAQAVFQTHRERIQMVVTDVMMPRMNGVELLEWLAETAPGLATLMVSGFAGSPLVQQWVDRDPTSFLPKPFEAPEFMARVQERFRARQVTVSI